MPATSSRTEITSDTRCSSLPTDRAGDDPANALASDQLAAVPDTWSPRTLLLN